MSYFQAIQRGDSCLWQFSISGAWGKATSLPQTYQSVQADDACATEGIFLLGFMQLRKATPDQRASPAERWPMSGLLSPALEVCWLPWHFVLWAQDFAKPLALEQAEVFLLTRKKSFPTVRRRVRRTIPLKGSSGGLCTWLRSQVCATPASRSLCTSIFLGLGKVASRFGSSCSKL